MKNLFSIVLCLMLLGCAVGCTGKAASSTSVEATAVTATPSLTPSPTPSPEPRFPCPVFSVGEVYSDENLVISFTECIDYTDSLCIVFSAESLTGKAYSFSATSISVNGIPLDKYYYCNVTPGTSEKSYLYLDYAVLAALHIDSIREITLVCEMGDKNDSSLNHPMEPFTLRNANAADYTPQTLQPFETLLYENDLVRLTATSCKEFSDSDYRSILIMAENKTDQEYSVNIQYDHPLAGSRKMFSLSGNSSAYQKVPFINLNSALDGMTEETANGLLNVSGHSIKIRSWSVGDIGYNIMTGEFDAASIEHASSASTVDAAYGFPLGILYEDDNVIIEYVGSTGAGFLSDNDLEFMITNLSDKELSILSTEIKVNGIEISAFLFSNIPVGETSKETVLLSSALLYGDVDVGEIHEVSFALAVNGFRADGYELPVLQLQNEDAGNYDDVKAASYDTVLFESDVVRITGKPSKALSIHNVYNMLVCIENKTDEDLTIFSETVCGSIFFLPDIYELEANDTGTFEISCMDPNAETLASKNDLSKTRLEAFSAADSKKSIWKVNDLGFHLLTGQFENPA